MAPFAAGLGLFGGLEGKLGLETLGVGLFAETELAGFAAAGFTAAGFAIGLVVGFSAGLVASLVFAAGA